VNDIDLSFLENYKTIRNKFSPAPVVVRLPVKEEPVTPPPLPEVYEVPSYRDLDTEVVALHGTKASRRDPDKCRKELEEIALEKGISYRQSLLEEMPVCSPRFRLAALFVLEEYSISWRQLFDGRRALYQSIIRWKMFRALRDEGMKLLHIGKLCNMDHTSVMHGLRKLDKLEITDDKP
jgi:hypothetical protein